MRSLIQWAIRNAPAMNTIMIAVLVLGAASMYLLRREEFPEFELEMILITVPYPGASPEEVESGICQKIEEAVRSIDGIKKQTTVAREGVANVVLELEASVKNVQKVLADIRSEVDRIPSFPEMSEDPEIKQVTMRRPAIKVGIVGPEWQYPEAERQLRAVAEGVRNELLQLDAVSQAEIQGARPYQIDIEIPEETLRKYGLTLKQVAQIVRRENIEMPGGDLKTDSEEVLLRGKNKRVTGDAIARIPLITQPDGAVLRIADLGSVRDDFADTTAISRINGQPGLVVSVNAASREDLLGMTEAVRSYVKQKTLPQGYAFRVWGDRSVNVRDRLDLLRRNGLQGLLLVFLVLTVFLELRLAWWVALGIPISVLGACGVLLYLGETLNMLSMFAFMMALGIVVDDAIVIGENIYAHRQQGKEFEQAAIDGTHEVLPSVSASVMTTIIAFIPMMFVSGVMGKFFAVLPVAMIAMLIISLLESMFILPCHLAHRMSEKTLTGQIVTTLFYPIFLLEPLTRGVNRFSGSGLNLFGERLYLPALRAALRNPLIVVSTGIAFLIFSAGAVTSGMTPWVFFPKLDGNALEAEVIYPNGTPSRVTDEATRRLAETLDQVNERFKKETGEPVVKLAHRVVGESSTSGGPGGGNNTQTGSHVGKVSVELVDTSERTVKSQEILEAWRSLAGELPGCDSLAFREVSFGPGGRPIEFKLLAHAARMDELERAVDRCKQELASRPGVFDVADDSRPGKLEFQMRVKNQAQSMGVPLAEVAETVRGAYYGEEVMRLQRGRHEVKLMVRYPAEERRSLADFDEIRVRAADGAERPLTELAAVDVQRGFAEINRIDQLRSITVSADVDDTKGNAFEITSDLRASFIPKLMEDFPDLRIRWEGQQEQQRESVGSLFAGFGVALAAMFVLLTVEFRSYVQPLIILLIIPFGAIGAIWGHVLLGLQLTLFSVLGLVALTGVVVNDSIVLMDFINARIEAGAELMDALLDAGRRRLRPVLLTSITTIAGLLPILMETSLQAQILIPMATSLCFGLLVATALVLFLVPTFYLLYAKAIGRGAKLAKGKP